MTNAALPLTPKKTLFSLVHFTARSVAMILLAEMLLIRVSYGHQTIDALL